MSSFFLFQGNLILIYSYNSKIKANVVKKVIYDTIFASNLFLFHVKKYKDNYENKIKMFTLDYMIFYPT